MNSIRYNMLNLPDTVQFRNGSAIVNYYTADGKRTGSKYLTPQTTVVIPAGQTFGSTSGTAAMSSHVTARRGSLEYAGADFESDTLIRIHNGDGYLDFSEQDFRYFVRDYQGNIRTVYGSAVAKLTPVETPFSSTIRGAIGGDKPPIRPKPIEHTVTYQRMQYYPFGLPYEAHYQPEEQPYKYGGKEFIELHDYDSYDFDARMYYPALCRFTTMDPLCEKYYSISPYAYCNNNPVKYVDPDGRDPIYTKNFLGKIKLIGDDGKNGTGSYLVRGSVAREVKRATKAGKFYTGDLSENKKVMHIPTGQKLEGVKQSYEDTKISQKENGGHANIGDANVTRWDEGPAAISFTDKDGNQGAKASLQMFVVNGKNTMPTDASNVEMWWHTHPNTTVNGISLGNSTPSDADYSGQKTMTNRGYKGNTFVIGIRSEKVTFFNKDGVLTTVKWEDFLRMGGQKK